MSFVVAKHLLFFCFIQIISFKLTESKPRIYKISKVKCIIVNYRKTSTRLCKICFKSYLNI